MKTPLISILVPFYNAALFLDEAITSITGQTFKDFELILINDASTDNSDEVVKKYLADKRIIYIKNPKRLSQIPNLNHGLKIAKADIIARLDGDDTMMPDRLEKQYKYLVSHPDIALVGSFIELIDEHGMLLQKINKPVGHENIRRVCFYYSPFAHTAIAFRKSAVAEVGNYRMDYAYREDIDLYFRLIFSGHKTDNIPEYLSKYRQHSNNVSNYARQNGKTSFRLKRDTIKAFHLRLSLKERLSMYVHYILDMTLSHNHKVAAETFIKKVLDRLVHN